MPLVGPLDTRSRPAEQLPGSFRWLLNFGVNHSGKRCTHDGFAALDYGALDDVDVTNWDRHFRGADRTPLTFGLSVTANDKVRYLYTGDETSVSVLDPATSEWTDVITGMGEPGARWRGAYLNNQVLFTNNVDKPQLQTVGGGAAAEVPDLNTLQVEAAKVVLQFAGVAILMNTVENGVRYPSRIRYSDRNTMSSWQPASDSVAAFQDLDPDEEILNAVEMNGIVYVFTTLRIWKMFVQVTDDYIFGFTRWYSDPKNRTACLAYENAVVSSGKETFYLGRETIYWFNQYSANPTSPDWLLKASGTMFAAIDLAYCQSPVAWFNPASNGSNQEILFSYSRTGADGVNDYTLALHQNTESITNPYQTASYIDHGFTMFVSHAVSVEADQVCNAVTKFISASGADWCLKEMGGVFYRKMVTLGTGDSVEDPRENDIEHAEYGTSSVGYYNLMRGLAPLGYPNDEKIVREVALDHDTPNPTDPTNLLKLRLGNSYSIVDANSEADTCRVQWSHIEDDKPLQCPNEATIEEMTDEGQRPDDATRWQSWIQNRQIYFEVTVTGPTGAAPIGADSAWASLTFDSAAA